MLESVSRGLAAKGNKRNLNCLKSRAVTSGSARNWWQCHTLYEDGRRRGATQAAHDLLWEAVAERQRMYGFARADATQPIDIRCAAQIQKSTDAALCMP